MAKAVDSVLFPESVVCDACVLRPWRIEDRQALILHAGSSEVLRRVVPSNGVMRRGDQRDDLLGYAIAECELLRRPSLKGGCLAHRGLSADALRRLCAAASGQ
jgi:hypothetical protein